MNYTPTKEKLSKSFSKVVKRIILLPSIAFIIAALLSLNKMEATINVLMNAMPMAISMMVLSHRYKFYEDVIASIILISSIGAIAYLNIWLLLLGF